MQIFDDPRRLRLSGMAAAGADVQPQLRLLMLAEALAAPPTHRALDLSAETAVLCTAASEAVRRRPGWLYVMPSPAPLPVALPRNLWQAAVLCVLRCVLPAGRAAVTLQPGAGAAVAVFRAVSASGMPADTLPLLRRAAALTGGLCLATGSPVHRRSADAAIPHILPPPCACRWPPTFPCVSRPLPKIYCMTGTALCRSCWMGLRYREDGCTHNILQILYRTGQN